MDMSLQLKTGSPRAYVCAAKRRAVRDLKAPARLRDDVESATLLLWLSSWQLLRVRGGISPVAAAMLAMATGLSGAVLTACTPTPRRTARRPGASVSSAKITVSTWTHRGSLLGRRGTRATA